MTLTNVPHVESSAFKDYLGRIGPLFETFHRGRAEGQAAAAAQVFEKDRQNIHDASLRPGISRQGSVASLASLSPLDSPQPRRRSSAYGRRRANEPTPLSTIPGVYLEENFQLENPRTFDVVSERAGIVRPPPGTEEKSSANGAPLPPRKALATNAILQEKLSWYMDTVEVHLINSISSASTGFFAALGSLRDLQSEAADSVAKIKKLREDLAKLDQDMAMGGLKVANTRRRRENVRKLGQATKQVQRIVADVKHCEELVDNGEYDTAADNMRRVERLITGERIDEAPDPDSQEPPLPPKEDMLDLRGLKALQGLSEGMRQLQLRIGSGYQARFLEALLSDLRQHVEKIPPKDTLRRWASSFHRSKGGRVQAPSPVYMEPNEKLRKDLLASLSGLSKSGQTIQATNAFRDAVMKEIKTVIRRHLPSSSDDDTESMASVSTRMGGKGLSQQEKSAILARNLRALDDEDAEKLLVNVYTDVSESLRRLSMEIKVLLDVTSTFSSANSPPGSPSRSPTRPSIDAQMRPNTSRRQSNIQEELTQALDMSSLIGQAVDTAQTQISRVLKVRTEQTSKLPLERFLRYFTLNRLFADECEAVSGRSGSALRGIVNAQINAFVQTLGGQENQGIAQLLDNDQWEAKDFREPDSELLKKILAFMDKDPPEWTKATHIWEDFPSAQPTTNGTSSASTAPPSASTTPSKPAARPAYIDETRFILVSSAISLLPAISHFLTLITCLPSTIPTAVPALCEILRTFNSRSCQLILGAGATRSAGLKNITTKHLALASQGCSFVVALVPYLREGVRRHIGTGSGGAGAGMLAEFDRTKRLVQDHQQGIHDKLVEIMTSRAQSHIAAMKKIDFDADAAGEKHGGPNAYMETLTKETGTLYRVLGRHLDDGTTAQIMSAIFFTYREIWLKAFEEREVKTVRGKERYVPTQLLDLSG